MTSDKIIINMAIDYTRLATLGSRLMLWIAVLLYSIDFFDAAGERVYNKYLHSLRKMIIPNSKPGDSFPYLSLTWNDLNMIII